MKTQTAAGATNHQNAVRASVGTPRLMMGRGSTARGRVSGTRRNASRAALITARCTR